MDEDRQYFLFVLFCFYLFYFNGGVGRYHSRELPQISLLSRQTNSRVCRDKHNLIVASILLS